MSQTIDSLAAEARTILDEAYGLTPERNMEEMKAEALAAVLLSSEDKEGWLNLAAQTPDQLISQNTQVYAEIYSNGSAIISAALDDEANILTNP